MIWIIVVIGVVLACVVYLLVMPIEIHLRYEHVKEDDSGILEFRYFFGLVRHRRELKQLHAKVTKEGPSIKAEAKVEDKNTDRSVTAKDVTDALRDVDLTLFREVTKIILGTARRLKVQEFQLEMSVGVPDAVLTGMTVGFLYAVIYGVLGASSHICQFADVPKVIIHPVFNRTAFQMNTKSIMRIRLGYAISAGVRLERAWKRRT